MDKEKLSNIFKYNISVVLWKLARFFILLGLIFIIIYPLLTILTQAFRPIEEFRNPAIIWITVNPTWENIKLSWQVLSYPRAFYNSFALSTISAALQLVSCSLAGYGFAKFRFKGRELLFAGVILTMIIPQQMLFLPMYLYYRFFDFLGLSYIPALLTGQHVNDFSISLYNNKLSFYIPSALGVGLRSGLFIYIFRQFFRNIPNDLIEAAKIDGCGAFKTFLQIMVPVAKTSFITVFLFSIVWHWNETAFSNVFFMRDNRPLSSMLGYMYDELAASNLIIHEGYNVAQKKVAAYSGTLLYIAPLLIFYIFTQRYFIEGVETTGIKG